jgi:hypothetical protein
MSQLRIHSAAEQVAAHLRAEMLAGVRTGMMHGVNRIASDLGANHKTVEVALKLLEKEGLLISQGARRGRLIDVSGTRQAPPGLRVALLMMDTYGTGEDFMIELRHLLEEAGHTPFFPDKTLLDLGMDVTRVAHFVKRTDADAWVIVAGSYDILEWFSRQPVPAFAMFGRRRGLPIAAAGPDKSLVYSAITQNLIKLGHRRITLLCRNQRRLPIPGRPECAFLEGLKAHNISVGDFNLPDWKESKEGFLALLESLFRLTPPTALVVDELFLFNAALYFVTKRGLRVPDDISLICTDSDQSFAWCEPSVAHIRWDYRPVVRRIVRWVANTARGKEDLRQTLTRAEFVDGGTMGAVRD